MALSQYFEDAILNWFKGTAFPAVPTNEFISLHTGDPGQAGANEVSATGTAYARVSVAAATAWSALSNEGTGRKITNAGAITFPNPTGDWGVVTYFGVWSAATGGNYLRGGPLANSVRPDSGASGPTFAAGALTLSEA